ncbi:hypothetical protein ACFST9_23875 [Hymenobacter monticola]|uniref:Uncharacterized protein n=1 Tax=Hymenobacter monticola TaxID=1705399 RepID=A0ABY4B3Z5_9BACT|nr:hypothetical protein [Hymenobacter monticola]UOE33862.1 hypothetical protein MTP16_22450 [Hymenobacter monticola]
MNKFLRAAGLLSGLLFGLRPAADAQTAGGVGIGTATPDASALLDLTSTTRGLLAPRMTAVLRAGIQVPAPGLLVYQTDGVQPGFWYYTGAAWTYLNPAPAGDNLGNHTATQNLNLADKQLVGNGGTSGLGISSSGDVVIGTGSPLAPLEVRRDNANAYALFHDPFDAYFSFGQDRSDNNNIKISDGNGFSNGVNYLTIARASTNVGIGTTAPSQKLEVAGQVYSSTGGFRFPDNTVQTTAAAVPAPQTLTLNGQQLSISGTGGNSVTLPSATPQTLTLNGQQLSISGGNAVTLPTPAGDNLGNHTATQNLNLANKLLVGNGGASGLAISNGGSVGIGTTSPAASALLDISSTTKGLLPPRLTEAQRDAIANPAPGLEVFNTTANTLSQWDGTRWVNYLSYSASNTVASTTFSFQNNGNRYTYQVPLGVTRLAVDMAGGVGGGSVLGTRVVNGGKGGRVQATLTVTPGQLLTIYVGGSGTGVSNNGGVSDLAAEPATSGRAAPTWPAACW